MCPPAGAETYRRVEITSRTPVELIVMLYDGALLYIDQAGRAIQSGDIPARRIAIDRALAIVSELQNTLNFSEGGEIAAQLDALYTFVTGCLIDASVRQDANPLVDAAAVMSNLRESWVAIRSETAGRA